jgi:branched-subunit amino acid ABC-type transport system permease component
MTSHSADDPKQVTRTRSGTRYLYAAFGALVLFAAIDICQSDTALFLNVFLVAPILFVGTIFLVVYAAINRKNRRRSFQQLATLAIFWVVATAFFLFDIGHPIAIRSTARWLVWSHDYKARVIAQPSPPNGELKHIEWDGWGILGMDTSAFLVFDPADSLSVASSSNQSGKFNGIPCRVFRVRRLEAHWYTVIYNTGPAYWDGC